MLVMGIGVRIQKEHGDGLDAARAQLVREPVKSRHVERYEHLTERIDALDGFEAQGARNERRVSLVMQVERVRPVGAGDLQNVAEALRRDERRLRAAALDEGVDDERRAVIDELRLRRPQIGLVEAIENTFDEIVIGRRAFGADDFLRLAVVADQIREGPADIHGDGE